MTAKPLTTVRAFAGDQGKEIYSGNTEFYVFTYGSLMYDGWEADFAGSPRGRGVLPGYRRSFCILETSGRWGTPDTPGLVLGLIKDAKSYVEGTLFCFPKNKRTAVDQYLKNREGPHHHFVEIPVRESREGSSAVGALVALTSSDDDAFVGHLPLSKRVRWVLRGVGRAGASTCYVFDTFDRLMALGIDDSEVTGFREAILKEKRQNL